MEASLCGEKLWEEFHAWRGGCGASKGPLIAASQHKEGVGLWKAPQETDHNHMSKVMHDMRRRKCTFTS